MSRIAFLVGSAPLELGVGLEPQRIDTPYGPTSGPLRCGRCGEHEVALLSRHGEPHRIAPHAVNYRGNLAALERWGADVVISLNTVGGIGAAMTPGVLALPHDLIDYSHGRAATFSDSDRLIHVEFSEPYAPALRAALLAAGEREGLALHDGGVYGCTQGPRFETPAEIDRLARDGCTLVGMTGMPEAALAAELELPYVSLCLVVNAAAGRGEGPIDLAAVEQVAHSGMARVAQLLQRLLSQPLPG